MLSVHSKLFFYLNKRGVCFVQIIHAVKNTILLLVVVTALSACGGGGGGSTTPPENTESSDWDTMKWNDDNWG